MKRGEVYTCFFENTGNTGLKEGKRTFILLEESESSVVGVTLTTRVNDHRESKKVYTFMTINRHKSFVCIFADMPFIINKSWLIDKKGIVDSTILNQIDSVAKLCKKIDLSDTNTWCQKTGFSLGDGSKTELSKEKSKPENSGGLGTVTENTTVIDEFITHYKKEYDFYETVSKLVAQQLENALHSSGIRAIVTYRAKNPQRLHTKLIQRNTDNHYSSFEDIYNDICDFSGVRVALYFPSDKDNVEAIINENFELLQEPKIFPDIQKRPNPQKRFSGYWARHYRVSIKENNLNETQLRYLNSKTEIQVASVLMHAWSEVEHDLVYKPLNGNLSDEELSILDELNGLVLAGEIALERLNKAANNRIKKESTFNNQYELASYLYTKCQNKLDSNPELKLGNVELLFSLMKECHLVKASDLNPYMKSLFIKDDFRSLSDQICDNIVSGDTERYYSYTKLKEFSIDSNPELHSAIGLFMEQWISLEASLNIVNQENNPKSRIPFSPNYLKLFFSQKECARILQLRKIRNMLVHGIEMPNPNDLKEMAAEIKTFYDKITSKRIYTTIQSNVSPHL